MEKEFVTYSQALALKELGFDEESFGHYRTYGKNLFYATPIARNLPARYRVINAPLYQQAFSFFREKHGLMHIINPYYFTAEIDYLNERIVNKQYGDFIPHDHLVDEEGEEIKHSSYEEAESACLDVLIEICKNK
jgi:hypothetical protein